MVLEPMLHQQVRIWLPIDTVLYYRRWDSSATPLSEH